MFICNHCPYVRAVVDKLAREGKALRDLGFGVAAICSNDSTPQPDDSFENMGAFAREHHFRSPTCTTSTRRSPGPTAPPAPRTSSASTPS